MGEIIYEKLTLEINRDNDGYTVTDCEKDAVSVLIPARVEGKPVKAIGEFAFEDCILLEKVEFEDYPDEVPFDDYGVTEIGDFAFSGCISLQRIELPYTVSYIGRSAFVDCVSLTEVESYGEMYIAPYAFYRCKNLKRVPIPKSITEGIFGYCESLEYFPVAEGMDTIEEDAFEHCDSLTKIVIPKSVEMIEQLAFRGCKNLTEAVFAAPDGWHVSIRYGTNTEFELNLDDPKENARRLVRMDFDDGVRYWYKKS